MVTFTLVPVMVVVVAPPSKVADPVVFAVVDRLKVIVALGDMLT